MYNEWVNIFKLMPDDKQRTELLFLVFDYSAGEASEDRIESSSEAVRTAFAVFRPRLDEDRQKWQAEREKRSNAGKIGGLASGEARRSNRSKSLKQNEANVQFASKSLNDNEANEAVHVPVHVPVSVSVHEITRKEKDIHSDECISKEKRTRFVPPTVEEISAYIFEHDLNVDPNRFFDFYSAKDWMIGKNKMKDWKAAVRTWARNDNQKSTATGRKPRNEFEELAIREGIRID